MNDEEAVLMFEELDNRDLLDSLFRLMNDLNDPNNLLDKDGYEALGNAFQRLRDEILRRMNRG